MQKTLATFVTVTLAALTIHCGGSVRSAGAASGSDGGGSDATASGEDSGSSGLEPPGADGSCEVCDAGCSNGLVTICLVLDPPGCGAQAGTQFCPYGCSPDAPGGCNFSPVDGGVVGGCSASSVTIQRGALLDAGGAPVAVSSAVGVANQIVIATSGGLACRIEGGDEVPNVAGDAVALTLDIPMFSTGSFGYTNAQLSVWKNGTNVIGAAVPTAGSITVSLSQPGEGGGMIGSYDLTFGSDVEQGTFVAPTCDICAVGP
jgi:hypothetical protein